VIKHRIALIAVLQVWVFAQNIQKLDPAMDQLIEGNASVETHRDRFQQMDRRPGLDACRHAAVRRDSGKQHYSMGAGTGCQRFSSPTRLRRIDAIRRPRARLQRDDGGFKRAGSRGWAWAAQCLPVGKARPQGAHHDPRGFVPGQSLNSPNDLTYKSDGSLYFTDPPYGLPRQSDNDPEKKLTVNGFTGLPLLATKKQVRRRRGINSSC